MIVLKPIFQFFSSIHIAGFMSWDLFLCQPHEDVHSSVFCTSVTVLIFDILTWNCMVLGRRAHDDFFFHVTLSWPIIVYQKDYLFPITVSSSYISCSVCGSGYIVLFLRSVLSVALVLYYLDYSSFTMVVGSCYSYSSPWYRILTLFFNISLTIFDFLCWHINCRLSLSVFTKETGWEFDTLWTL